MPRFQARDASGNSPSSTAAVTEANRHILMLNTATVETSDAFFERDFDRASHFIIDFDIGSGDTMVLEVRADSTAAWANEQTITADIAYAFTPSEQFRVRRTVDGGADTKVWLTARR